MSLNTTTDKVSFAGDNVTTVVPFPYKFFKNSDLVVKLVNATSLVETLLVLDTDYTITGAGIDAGGSITKTTAVPSGSNLIAWRDNPDTQETKVPTNGKISSADIETQLDKIVMMIQRLVAVQNRSFRLPEGLLTNFSSLIPVPLLADGYLKLNAAKTGFEFTTGVGANTPRTAQGARGAPLLITALAGIPFTSGSWETVSYVAGNGAPVDISAAARITAGTLVNQRHTIIGTSDANYVQMADGNGIVTGGMTIRLGNNSIAVFIWDGSNWILESTNGLTP